MPETNWGYGNWKGSAGLTLKAIAIASIFRRDATVHCRLRVGRKDRVAQLHCPDTLVSAVVFTVIVAARARPGIAISTAATRMTSNATPMLASRRTRGAPSLAALRLIRTWLWGSSLWLDDDSSLVDLSSAS